MAIFLVLPKAETPGLNAAIATQFTGESKQLNESQWLVSFAGTAKELSDKLKITDGTNGPAIVAGVDGYFGRYPTDVWEWLKAKLEAANGKK